VIGYLVGYGIPYRIGYKIPYQITVSVSENRNSIRNRRFFDFLFFKNEKMETFPERKVFPALRYPKTLTQKPAIERFCLGDI
jgi:hypothetical protein